MSHHSPISIPANAKHISAIRHSLIPYQENKIYILSILKTKKKAIFLP